MKMASSAFAKTLLSLEQMLIGKGNSRVHYHDPSWIPVFFNTARAKAPFPFPPATKEKMSSVKHPRHTDHKGPSAQKSFKLDSSLGLASITLVIINTQIKEMG